MAPFCRSLRAVEDSDSAIQPFSHSAIQPFSHSAIQPSDIRMSGVDGRELLDHSDFGSDFGLMWSDFRTIG